MKKLSTVLIVLACMLVGATAGAVRHPAGLMPVTITIKSHDNVYWLAQQGVSIEELHGLTAEARLTQSQIDMLTTAGYAVAPRAEAAITRAQLAGYHTYSRVGAFLDSIRTAYPAITRKVSFGTSVQGRSLWAFLITDNPDINENEAEIRLGANIHGDEVVGKELLLALIDSLTKTYATSATIANLINNREIWIVPCLNPDGLALSQRYNANGEDLNRDYPVPDGGSNSGSVFGTETETQQTMSYWRARHPALSMTFHGGAVVANYPWDYTTALCPDDAAARAASLGYSRLNAPMYNSSEFPNGITNGAAWYIVRGSLQDWSYNATGGLEITVECSGEKWPAAGALQGYWNDNKNSLLYLIRKAGEGIGGVVTDSITGQPLDGVTVTVAGNSKTVATDVPGDYHRILASGTYSLSFAKTGYTAKTVSNVSVNFDNLTTLNVALKPASSTPALSVSFASWSPAAAGGTSGAVSVTNSGSASVIAYTISSNQAWLTVSSASGNTPGSFTMTAAANTGAARSATVTVTATTGGVSGSPKTISVSQAGGSTQTTVFSDDMTGYPAGWTLSPTTGWLKSSTRYNSASYSARCDDASPYANTQNNYMTRSISLSGYSSATLTFYIWQNTESGYDYVYLQYYSGSAWTTAWSRAGSYQTWSQQSAAIPVTATQIRFWFKSDGSVTAEGAYVDDVVLTAGGGSAASALAISTASWFPAAAGGTSSAVSVTNSGSGSVIAYTVASNQTWLTVSQAGGNTPGSFTMTTAANTGAARSATVTVTATTGGVSGSPKTIPVTQAAGNQGGAWTDVSATTQSAHPYANNYNYTWTITGPSGASRMKVYFDSIKTETRYDSVFVLSSAGTVIQSFTGTYRAVWSNEVAGNVVKIRLKTDGSVTGFGFRSGKYSYYTSAAKSGTQGAGHKLKEYTELLCQNRPNPVTKGTQISYNLSGPQPVSLKIYNLNGQLVKILANGFHASGHYTVDWDGKDEAGRSVTAGAYVYRLVSENVHAVKLMMVIR